MTYFPYLRGRQFELLALRELVPQFSTAAFPDIPLPIVEPVKNNLSPLSTAIQASKTHSQQLIVIVNPSVGDLPLMDDIITLINASPDTVIPGFIVGNRNNRGTAIDFIRLSISNNVALIHENDSLGASSDSTAIRTAKM